MLFNSLEFLQFFCIVFTCYYLPFGRKLQPLILIAASFYFYWRGASDVTLLLAVAVVVNAVVSHALQGRTDSPRWRLLFLLGVLFNIEVLFVFKYGSLILGTANSMAGYDVLPVALGSLIYALVLPIGVSFYCFEGVSLVVDSAKGRFEKSGLLQHFQNTGLFIAFFPHLISGPILRAAEFFPQIRPKYFRDIKWQESFEWLILGYFLKVFVADNLSDLTGWLTFPVTEIAGTTNNIMLLMGYSVNIFADFAGYSYIALGLAKLLGYSIPNNFNAPYIACSLGEFWKRWHISLSSWIRDYLFIPLGGTRCVWYRAAFNLMFVMLLGGLWHGANWNYAIWGACHGGGLIAEHLVAARLKMKESTILSFIKMLLTYAFVTLCWIPFLVKETEKMPLFVSSFFFSGYKPIDILRGSIVLFYSIPVILLHMYCWNKEHQRLGQALFDNWLFRAVIAGIMLFLIFINPGPSYVFIYFQF
ncbi:MAG: hypothetical protein K2X93_28275 [Candidatus Obscuribacterales bacterium]|nr:hypothetical protein [Candidatus Obscuribacterales bacterium]